MLEDYEDEEYQNVIVDCDILEAAKENIQPLASGRRVTALASVLATPHGLRDARLEAAKAKLRDRVRASQECVDRLLALRQAEGSDGGMKDSDDGHETTDDELTLEEAEEGLLDAYVRLVIWTVEHYPRGQSAHSGILELLEEATRVMRHSGYAKADARYLNLWIRYATYVDHPEVIFEFLLANEIGAKWAKLYEEYAARLEKMNRRPKADEIYLLGIARKAEPLEHLTRRHQEFQKRMMVSTLATEADTAEVESTPAPGASKPEPRRRVLADSTSTSTLSSAATPLTSASSTFSVPASSSVGSIGSQAKLLANGKIPVFIDPAGEAESAPGNAWPELGTRAERIKENRRMPEKMQGTILKQRGAARIATKEAAARARAAPKIVPYRDPELIAPTASSSKTKTEVLKDPISSSTSDGQKFVPYRDPELVNAGSSNAKIDEIRDPEPSVPVSSSKIVPFKDPELLGGTSSLKKTPSSMPSTGPGPTPRRSSRLNPKRSAAEDVKSPIETAEEEPMKRVDGRPAAPARFVPFKDEDAGQVSTTKSSVSETAMRPKVPGGGGLGVAKAITEAEALRKDPFKNYKDL